MGRFSKLFGHQKETEAADWLKQQHIQIIAQNFTCKGGELDLIGLDTRHTLIFFEVKARKNDHYGHPASFITPQKQQKLWHAAQVFLQSHPQYQNHVMRFDSLCFLGDQAPDWQQNILMGQ